MSFEEDEFFMQQALRQANFAFEADEVPVGAIVVHRKKIIARAYNQVELLADPTAHAEILAITSACNFLGAKYLTNCSLYVTVEPCLMCAGALYWSKLARVVFGASDLKNGYGHTTGTNNPFHPQTEVRKGVLGDECASIMKEFFRGKRK